MDEERRSLQRKSMCSGRSRSSDRSYQNILQEFINKKPLHTNFVYLMTIEDERRQSRGSDLLRKLEESPNRNSFNVNENTNFNFSELTTYNTERYSQYMTILEHSCKCYTNCEANNCPCYFFVQPCVPGSCCAGCIEIKNSLISTYKNMNQQQNEVKVQQIDCACKKTRCLKMYCDCFAKNGFCSERCGCEDCLNQFDSEVRDKARAENLHNAEEKGCSCKKTKCEKKYCKCYGRDEKCSKFCTCENCNNMGEQLTNLRKKKQQVKMEVQEPIIIRNVCSQLPEEMQFQIPDFSRLGIQ